MSRWGIYRYAALCLALSAWLAGCESSDAPAPVTAPGSPAQVLKGFEMQDLRDGLKSMTLQSIEGRLYDDKHEAELEQPVVTFYKLGKPTSTLHAPKGRVDTLSHDMEAWGGVTVVTSDSATLTTDRLRYDPKKRKILSSDPVHMEKPDSITDGIGLDADPELTSVKIKHQQIRFRKAVSS